MTLTEQVNEIGVKLSMERHPSESILARAYLLLERDGLLPLIWHDGALLSLSGLLAQAKRKDVIYYAGYVQQGNDEPMLAGLGWALDLTNLGDACGYRATVGQAFLRQFWTKNIPRELATMFLDDGFEQCGIKVAYGYTPVANPVAVRFVTKMGFKRVGVAPSFSTWNRQPADVLISCMSRSDWNSPEKEL